MLRVLFSVATAEKFSRILEATSAIFACTLVLNHLHASTVRENSLAWTATRTINACTQVRANKHFTTASFKDFVKQYMRRRLDVCLFNYSISRGD